MPNNLTAQQIVEKWSQRGANSVETVKAGVNAVTVAPGLLAAARAQEWINGCQKAFQSKKWETKVAAVSLSDWKSAMLQKGINNMQTGYTSQVSKAKFQRFMQSFLPFARSVSEEIKAMPRQTLQHSIDRAKKAIERFAEWGQMGNVAPMPRMVG